MPTTISKSSMVSCRLFPASCGSCLFESHEVPDMSLKKQVGYGLAPTWEPVKEEAKIPSTVLTSCFIPDFDGTESVNLFKGVL